MRQPIGLFALAVLAVFPVAAARPDEAGPVYSLVAGRQIRFQGRGDFYCITRADGGRWCPEYASAWLDHARTLAGPGMAEAFGASSEHGPAPYRPVLTVILHQPGRVARIVLQAEADAAGRACLPGAAIERLGWRPEGPGIESVDEALCADLADIAALPMPPPILVRSSDDVEFPPRRRRRR